jgi:hypothetical protein
MRITEVVEPRSFIESIRLDDERISFPFPDRPAEHPRIRLFGKCTPVSPDDAMHVMPIEDLKHTAWNLNEFEIARIVFQYQKARYAERVAIPHRIISQRRRYRARPIARLIRIESLLSLGCKWRGSFAQPEVSTTPYPDPRQITWIMRWARFGVSTALSPLAAASASLSEHKWYTKTDDDEQHDPRNQKLSHIKFPFDDGLFGVGCSAC